MSENETEFNLTALDYAQITSLLNGNLQSMDKGDWQSFIADYTDDGIFFHPYRKLNIEGQTNLKQFLISFAEKPNNKIITHWESNIAIQVGTTKHSAINNSYWQAIKDGIIITIGTHMDELKKVDGKWKIQKRTVLVKWTKEEGNVQTD
ncbi:unnamed protein product [Didymodactylos carnosus]|uniref:SnoaL-like domain-containing protein n=1 Tax=Didymodactylos carnosus TaxID=1234261 RepID=A0A814PVI2_9BILA|nr:unnamed protein product [Didymodactylos carnosus]CAF1110941.1 unnamed protein product [Didymodactylos carnosus]CAF3652949.1 unnamed protein product [Didymodactylos carnosus]CAF3875309.1 unnamed protein product [Didymodactylos carnosus]